MNDFFKLIAELSAAFQANSRLTTEICEKDVAAKFLAHLTLVLEVLQ